ncbi:MAG: TonB-dependent receptor [Bacteroidota bacterium]
MRMYIMPSLLLWSLMSLFTGSTIAQPTTVYQTLRGTIFDQATQQPLAGARVEILDLKPVMGAMSDSDGEFVIEKIPVGRYQVQISYLGYQTQRKGNVILRSAQETVLEIGMNEQAIEGEAVVIEADQRQVTNEASLVSARSFSVEELQRIPGGLDDPARTAVKFPGVSPNPDALVNELNVRGNNSRAVIWRLEGVDIYNPNHFALVGGSGGSVTLFSKQLLTNTDFFSGAFPADYGNALGGVFDARFRNGNTRQRQHAVQLSLLGLDISTEGPFSKSGKNSYLANYRYSTTGLIQDFIEVGTAIPTYQDLSFKLHFQLPNAGTLNIFGIGGTSVQDFAPVMDTTRWAEAAGLDFGNRVQTTTGTVGATYAQPVGKKSFFQTALIGTGLRYTTGGYYLRSDLVTRDSTGKSLDYEFRLSWSSYFNHKFGPRHTHRTGLMVHGLSSQVLFVRSDNFWDDEPGGNLSDTLRVGQDESVVVNAFSRSQFVLSSKWKLNVGVHFMYLAYTGEASLEPRLGLRYQFNPRQSLSFGYGLHSQMEPFFAYIVQRRDAFGDLYRYNRNLGFNKAHHLVLSYRWQPSDKLRLGIEAYYQQQFNLVVGKDLPVSRVGGQDFFFETLDLDNGGTGRNMGIELALERNFSDGYYFLLNASLFDATYTANDQITRPSRFNNRLIANGVIGKEWKLGKKRGKVNLLNLNISGTYSGPQYYTPFNLEVAIDSGRIETDLANPNTGVQDPLFFLDASVVYQRNLLKRNSQIFLQIKNVLNQRPFLRQAFNRTTRETRDIFGSGLVPVLGWKMQF